MTGEAPDVVALIAAHNEADVIGAVVSDLIGQGVSVYLLDDGSTDDTVARVRPFLGRGLLGIEAFGAPDGRFSLERIVARKEQLARELPGDWFVNADADEFRESPFPGMGFLEGVGVAARLGYNAIDFAVLNFWPTHDDFRAGQDPRESFRHYEAGADFDRLQVRCWRRCEGLDLRSTAGHEARFPGRRVFPVRFLLRHYPIRGQAHGERKVRRERVPRFDPAEVAHGWHVQYSGLAAGGSFLRDPATLVPFDPLEVRLDLLLHPRRVEELEAALGESEGKAEQLERERDARLGDIVWLQGRMREAEQGVAWLQGQRREAEREIAGLQGQLREAEQGIAWLQGQRQEAEQGIAWLQGRLREAEQGIAWLRGVVADRDAAVADRDAALDALRRELAAVHGSLAWRLGAALRRLGGGKA